jgi:hypothetical protein
VETLMGRSDLHQTLMKALYELGLG